jgi:hypothetical protein
MVFLLDSFLIQYWLLICPDWQCIQRGQTVIRQMTKCKKELFPLICLIVSKLPGQRYYSYCSNDQFYDQIHRLTMLPWPFHCICKFFFSSLSHLRVVAVPGFRSLIMFRDLHLIRSLCITSTQKFLVVECSWVFVWSVWPSSCLLIHLFWNFSFLPTIAMCMYWAVRS